MKSTKLQAQLEIADFKDRDSGKDVKYNVVTVEINGIAVRVKGADATARDIINQYADTLRV